VGHHRLTATANPRADGGERDRPLPPTKKKKKKNKRKERERGEERRATGDRHDRQEEHNHHQLLQLQKQRRRPPTDLSQDRRVVTIISDHDKGEDQRTLPVRPFTFTLLLLNSLSFTN
jgi:hypothetical protein